MSIKIEGGAAENIIKAGTSNQLLYNDKEVILKENFLNLVYPVGSIYWSSKNTNPGTLFGGTWVRIKDKFLWAMGDSDTLNSTGGEKTHTLATDEMPSHNHIFRGIKNTVNVSGGNHRHSYNYREAGSGSSPLGGTRATAFPSRYTEYSGNLSMSGEFTPSGNIDNTGGINGITQPHNNMPPYIVKYCWERTA